MRRILIIGGTSAIAIACMRQWAVVPTEFILVGRDPRRLEAVGADIAARSAGSSVTSLAFDFARDNDIDALLDDVFGAGAIDIALIAHGTLPDQNAVQGNLDAVRAALETNAVSAALFAEAVACRMEKAGRGRLAVISSVAGDRGRKSNYVYGAAKALLSEYTAGLWHRFADSPVSVTLVKPGPTATPMTENLRRRGARLASADAVAAAIVSGVDKRVAVLYTPPMWRLIMVIVRAIPRPIFRKLPL